MDIGRTAVEGHPNFFDSILEVRLLTQFCLLCCLLQRTRGSVVVESERVLQQVIFRVGVGFDLDVDFGFGG